MARTEPGSNAAGCEPECLKNLKTALLELNSTGPEGFEGLVALILESITGVPFRLASSGLQSGVDGVPKSKSDHLSFECKLYRNSLDRDKVLSKLAELSIRTDLDVWVLSATVPVSAQLAHSVQSIAEEQALEVVILDWSSPADLPPLAVACAMVSDELLAQFIKSSELTPSSSILLRSGIEGVRCDSRFANNSIRLREQLSSAETGIESMRRANVAWMHATLADRDQARRAFGQPLAPGATREKAYVDRPALVDSIQRHIAGNGSELTLYVVGNEGVGKSWVTTKAWLDVENPPALFFINPSVVERASSLDGSEILAAIVGKQVGASTRENSRWHRKLQRWFRRTQSGDVRFVVYLDGVNEKPNVDWALFIHSLEGVVGNAGGRIIVSSRAGYFQSHIKGRLLREHKSVLQVSEWSESERNSILAARGIDASGLASSTLRSLRNPRLLSVALELLDNDTIRGLNELPSGRLLFEHIRLAHRDSPVPQPAHTLINRLRENARDLLSRVRGTRQEGRYIFASLDSVVDGHFFEGIDDDPSRYKLSGDGLRLALALALIDRLQSASEADRPMVAEVNGLIDPIAALDDASGVLLAAIAVSCVQTTATDELRSALLTAFAGMQNADEAEFDSFAAQFLDCPSAFMMSAEQIFLLGGQQPSATWIERALLRARSVPSAWESMQPHLKSWLVTHCLHSERSVPPGWIDGEPERAKQRAMAEEKLRVATCNLSKDEERIFDRVREVPLDPDKLHDFALQILFGMPLAPFAEDFAVFALARVLDPSPLRNDEDLFWLGWSNNVDWIAMRSALQKQIARLAGGESSKSGKWAAVALLRMTGDISDAKDADAIAIELVPDYSFPQTWRLVESMSDTDPCDPRSVAPSMMSATVQKFRDIPPGKLYARGATMEADLTFERSLLCIVRHDLPTGVRKVRELAAQVLTRSGLELRQGLIAVNEHSAAIGGDLAKQFLQLRSSTLEALSQGVAEQDREFMSHCCLSISFPHVSGSDQVAALTANALEQALYLNLEPAFKPATPSDIEEAMTIADGQGDARVTSHLLFYLHADVPISIDLLNIALALCSSADQRTRIIALSLLRKRGACEHLVRFVSSGWSAKATDNPAEARFGSLLLVEAVRRAGVAPSIVVERISPEHIGALATTGEAGAALCGVLLEDAIRSALSAEVQAPAVQVEIQPTEHGGVCVDVQSIREQPRDVHELLVLSAKVEAERFNEQQRLNGEALESFRDELASKRLLLVMYPLQIHELEAILVANPSRATEWRAALDAAPARRRPALRNLALAFAAHLSTTEPTRALALIAGYAEVESLVRYTSGYSRGAVLEHVIWKKGGSSEIDALRRQRLDEASDDFILSREVLVAELHGHQAFLDDYVKTGLASPVPANQARAITVAGFRNAPETWTAELTKYGQGSGFLRQAHDAARYAFERNQWAKHWYGEMCQARSPEEYWRSSKLFEKIVDMRLDLWASISPKTGEWVFAYSGESKNPLRRRLEKWQGDREKTLFGSKRSMKRTRAGW